MSDLTPVSNAAPEGSGKRAAGYAGYVFFVLFCVSVLNNLDRYVLTGAANVVSKELGLSIDQIPRTECLKDVVARFLPYWYDAVVASTGFAPYRPRTVSLSGAARVAADECRPYYERLHSVRLRL